MKRTWTKEEIEYFRKNYSITLDRDLSKHLKRGLGAISYMAVKLSLRKDKSFYEKSRKKTEVEFSKSKLESMYNQENKSTRKIASELGVGKTTIEYYLKKYQITLRDHSASNKVRFLTENSWIKGLNKNKDPRVKNLAENIKKAYEKKREEKIKSLEEKYNLPCADLLAKLYWKDKLTQEKIAQKLDLDRSRIIRLMKAFNIKKRPNFEFIASLQGKDRPMSGKKWEDISGEEKALERKKAFSIRAKQSIIKRLQNNEMPFYNTKIEKKLEKEMLKRKILFSKQYLVEDKFVCDFAIPELKIAIEADGDYWHANPKFYNSLGQGIRQKRNVQKDKYEKIYLGERGWLLLRFYESEIKSDVGKCVDEIEKAINSRKK